MLNTQQRADLAYDVYGDRHAYVHVPGRQDQIDIGGHEYYVLKTSENEENGFYAAVYQSVESGEIVVAFRGPQE